MSAEFVFAFTLGFLAGSFMTCLIVKIVDMTHKEHFRRMDEKKERSDS